MFQFLTPQSNKLDPIDDQILLGVNEGKSLEEIASDTSRSFSGIRKICREKLEPQGYLIYHPHKARARELTQQGKDYLQANGLLQVDVFR